MSNKPHTLHLHCCGGAGINIGNLCHQHLSALGDGFADIETTHLDTSMANLADFKEILEAGNYHVIKSNDVSQKHIDGSGGDRRKNYKYVVPSVREYMDEMGLSQYKPGETHVVIFSAGGGSGSVIGPVLLQNMVSRDIPAIAVVVGDATTNDLAVNTRNTILTLSSLAKKANRPLVSYYIANHEMEGDSIEEKLANANTTINTVLATFSVLVSGVLYAMDSQDVYNMLDFSKDSRLSDIPAGLYNLLVYTGDNVEMPEYMQAITARTVGVEGKINIPDIDMLTHKFGFISLDNIDNVMSTLQGNMPIHYVVAKGLTPVLVEEMDRYVKEFEKLKNSIKADSISTPENVIIEDDGMVL